MEPNVILKDLFCKQCKLQFNKKIVYDIHLNIVHKKDRRINSEQEEIGSGRKSSVKLSLIKPSKNHGLCLSPRSSLERLEKQSKVTISPTQKDHHSFLKRKLQQYKKFKQQNPSFIKDISGPTSYDIDLNIVQKKDRINSELEDYKNVIPTSGVNSSVSEEPAIDNSTIHEGKNLYKCIFCDDSFSNHISLKIHNELLHVERKPHKCLICDYICYSSKNLKKHSDEVHDGKNLDIKVECNHAPMITFTGHKNTNPTSKAHYALPIQKLDEFESPSAYEHFSVVPKEPWLTVPVPTSLAQSSWNPPGFGPSTSSNNEPILGKVLRLSNSVSITFVINLLFVRLSM